MKSGFRFSWWWLAIIVLIAGVRIWTNASREYSHSSAAQTSPAASGDFKVYTSTQPGEEQVSAACEKAIDVSNGSESISDFKAHASETVRVCSAAYQYALKDAAQDSEEAHFMDENNAATVEEMVSAALGLQGDKAGSKDANDKALALAQDVVKNSHEPHLVSAAEETVRELSAPIASPSAATP
jgi:hypothetical protein